MSIIDKFKHGLMGNSGDDLPPDEPEENEPKDEPEDRPPRDNVREFPKRNSAPRADNVIDFRAAEQAHNRSVKVLVVEPQAFDDGKQIADSIKEKKPVVINFERTEGDVARRIVDFLSGTTYALAGDIKKVGHNVYLCAPSNVNVTYTKDKATGSMDFSWIRK